MNKITPLLFIFVCFAVSITLAQSSSPSSPAFKEADCPFDTGKFDTDRLQCGYVVVPANRQKESQKTLKLAVGIMKAQAPDPQADPFMYIIGGPGGHALPGSLLGFDPMFQDRDVVIVDYRGTGYSEPKMCPWLQQTNFHIAALDLSDSQAGLMQKGALLGCRDKMLSKGVDLEAFGVSEVAADLNDVGQALGYQKLNILGQSYGAMVAEAMVRDYPERVKSVILVGPASISNIENLAENVVPSFADALHKIFNKCEEDIGCRTAYPQLKDEFYNTISALRSKPLDVNINNRYQGRESYIVNSQDFIGTIYNMLFNEQSQSLVPAAIHAFSTGGNKELAKQFLLKGFADMSIGMMHSAMCYDAPAERSAYDSALAEHPMLRSSSPDLKFWNDICENWHTARATPDELAPVESPVPVLAISGGLDPVIPESSLQDILEGFPNSYYVYFPSQTHNPGPRSGRCVTRLVNDFMNNPSIKPDTSCVENVPDIEFAVPKSSNSRESRGD